MNLKILINTIMSYFYGSHMEGPKNELKDERNVNSFKSALTLSWTGDCREEDDVELILVIYCIRCM